MRIARIAFEKESMNAANTSIYEYMSTKYSKKLLSEGNSYK